MGYVADTIYREVTDRSYSPYEITGLAVGNLNYGGLMYAGPKQIHDFAANTA